MGALVLADPGGGTRPGSRRRYAVPVLLIAGWLGLFAYSAAYLTEDLPFRSPSVGAAPSVAIESGLHFVAREAAGSDLADELGIARRLVAVGDTRAVTKEHMLLNDALPDVRVDSDSFAVHVDGELIEPQPVDVLPMAQRYFLF